MKGELDLSSLEQLKSLDRAVITPAEAAKVLMCDPQYIRCQAQRNAAKLPFPVMVIGRRVKIPRLPFIAFIEGGANGW